MLDFVRIGCAVPEVSVGNVQKNVQSICDYISRADEKACDLVVFPELAMTGYTCGDLFFQSALQTAVNEGLSVILECSAEYPDITVVVGLPAMIDSQLYNCAAIIGAGELRGLSVKTFIPNYDCTGEHRWFASAAGLRRDRVDAWELGLKAGYSVPVGNDLIYRIGDGAIFGVELCEDLWAPIPPSSMQALGGAQIIVNPAASHETAGKRAQRRQMVERQSAASQCIYAFCSAGATESTQDLVYSGHALIGQMGTILAENEKQIDGGYMLVQDADVGIVRSVRSKNTTFRESAEYYGKQNPARVCERFPSALRSDGASYPLTKLPFVPQEQTRQQCYEIFNIQVEGLKRRLEIIKANAVVGISGGLDSTLALLVAVEAMRRLGRPLTDVYGITMPCFGTSDRTYNNALELMRILGISSKEISIRDAVTTHFRDIGHDPSVRDTTYENAQARERTQILMDYAGEVGGIVVGTGDLSELALGWCTYNGDHMSMYSVNGSVPKTLIPYIIEAVAETPDFQAAKAVLKDVIDTPISPELLPPDAAGKISQQTEDIVGPYVLHDFFIYYALRYGFAPEKIYTMACRAFADEFTPETVKKWLQNFYRRFFTQQFKRNCQPDGVRTGAVGLSPRSDWKMPSDAAAAIWLEEAEKLL